MDFDFSKIITPQNWEIFNKSKIICEKLLNFNSRYNFRFLEDNLIHISFYDIPYNLNNDFNNVRTNQVLKPYYEDVLKSCLELIEFINKDEEIQNSNYEYSFDELFKLNESDVYNFAQAIVDCLKEQSRMTLLQLPSEGFLYYEFLYYYQNFERHLYSPSHTYKIFIEFQNLTIDKNFYLKLNDLLTIRNLTNEESYFLSMRRNNDYFYRSGNIENPVLLLSFNTHKNRGYNMKHKIEYTKGVFSFDSTCLDEIIFDMLSILRLSNIKYVGFKRIFHIHAGVYPWCSEYFMPYLYSLPYYNSNKENCFYLKESNAKTLLDILDKYFRKRKNEHIALAISRFNAFYERNRPEDKIIDAIVGIEILLQLRGIRRKKDKIIKELKKILCPIHFKECEISSIDPIIELRDDILHDKTNWSKEKINESAVFMNKVLRQLLLINLDK